MFQNSNNENSILNKAELYQVQLDTEWPEDTPQCIFEALSLLPKLKDVICSLYCYMKPMITDGIDLKLQLESYNRMLTTEERSLADYIAIKYWRKRAQIDNVSMLVSQMSDALNFESFKSKREAVKLDLSENADQSIHIREQTKCLMPKDRPLKNKQVMTPPTVNKGKDFLEKQEKTELFYQCKSKVCFKLQNKSDEKNKIDNNAFIPIEVKTSLPKYHSNTIEQPQQKQEMPTNAQPTPFSIKLKETSRRQALGDKIQALTFIGSGVKEEYLQNDKDFELLCSYSLYDEHTGQKVFESTDSMQFPSQNFSSQALLLTKNACDHPSEQSPQQRNDGLELQQEEMEDQKDEELYDEQEVQESSEQLQISSDFENVELIERKGSWNIVLPFLDS